MEIKEITIIGGYDKNGNPEPVREVTIKEERLSVLLGQQEVGNQI